MAPPNYDVAILGGGPAGSVTAALLARAGAAVVLLERERFPRFHIGEALAPHAVRVLDRLGLLPQLDARYLRTHAVRFVCCRTGRQTVIPYHDAHDPAPGHGYQVPRADFDDLLLRHARELGATVLAPCTVQDLRFDRERATGVRARHANGHTLDLDARIIVDATGQDALLASRARVRHPLPDLDRSALFAHYQGVARGAGRDEGNLDIVIFPHGWLWHIPFHGGVASLGAVCSAAWSAAREAGETLDSFFDRTLDDAPFARDLLRDATRLAPVRAATNFAHHVDRLAGPGWLLVGDAAGSIDPLFASGLHGAITGAAAAAAAILDALASPEAPLEPFVSYERRARAAAELYLAATRSFYHGDLADQLFDAPRPTRQALASLFAGDVYGDDPPWRAALRHG